MKNIIKLLAVSLLLISVSCKKEEPINNGGSSTTTPTTKHDQIIVKRNGVVVYTDLSPQASDFFAILDGAGYSYLSLSNSSYLGAEYYEAIGFTLEIIAPYTGSGSYSVNSIDSYVNYYIDTAGTGSDEVEIIMDQSVSNSVLISDKTYPDAGPLDFVFSLTTVDGTQWQIEIQEGYPL